MDWYVYILTCADGTLYTGVTSNLEKRIRQHNGELFGGAKYTRSRRPVEISYKEDFDDRARAQSREYEIKKLHRIDKMKLIENNKLCG